MKLKLTIATSGAGSIVNHAENTNMEEKDDLSFADSYQWNQPIDKVKEILGLLLKLNEAAAGSITQTANENDDAEEVGQIYLLTAKNPNAPAAILDALTKLRSNILAVHVAENPNTESNTLNDLAFHDEPDVRAAVAENANTTMETMWLLACDEHPDIRFNLAENHNNSLDLLQTLAEDENPYVAHRAKRTIRRLQAASMKPQILSPSKNSGSQKLWSSSS